MDSAEICDALHFEEHVVRMVLSALNSAQLPAQRGRLRLPDAEPLIQKLVNVGCERKLLLDCLAFAQLLPDLCETTSSSAFDKIINGISDLQAGLSSFSDVSLPFLVKDGPGDVLVARPVSGSLHLSPKTKRELQRLHDAATHLQKSALRKGLPLKRQIGRIAWLWPAFYVQYSTGATHYPKVGELLGHTIFGAKNPDQLSKAAKEVREQCPVVIPWLLMALGRLPTEASAQPGAPGKLVTTYWVESAME